jgi:hypothetical protein
MPDPTLNQKASELLAKKIVTRLVKDGLLPEMYASEAQLLLSQGAPNPEDWQLLAEKAIEFETKGDHNEQQKSN